MTFARTILLDHDAIRQVIDEAMEYLSLLKENGCAANVNRANYRRALEESMENALARGNLSGRGTTVTVHIEADDHRAFITVSDGDADTQVDAAGAGQAAEPDARRLYSVENLYLVESLDNGRSLRIEV